MAILIKADPIEISGDVISLQAPPYKSAKTSPGDRVYLWWSERAGGAGLVAHGTVFKIDNAATGTLSVEVIAEVRRPLNNAMLEHRAFNLEHIRRP